MKHPIELNQLCIQQGPGNGGPPQQQFGMGGPPQHFGGQNWQAPGGFQQPWQNQPHPQDPSK